MNPLQSHLLDLLGDTRLPDGYTERKSPSRLESRQYRENRKRNKNYSLLLCMIGCELPCTIASLSRSFPSTTSPYLNFWSARCSRSARSCSSSLQSSPGDTSESSRTVLGAPRLLSTEHPEWISHNRDSTFTALDGKQDCIKRTE